MKGCEIKIDVTVNKCSGENKIIGWEKEQKAARGANAFGWVIVQNRIKAVHINRLRDLQCDQSVKLMGLPWQYLPWVYYK